MKLLNARLRNGLTVHVKALKIKKKGILSFCFAFTFAGAWTKIHIMYVCMYIIQDKIVIFEPCKLRIMHVARSNRLELWNGLR